MLIQEFKKKNGTTHIPHNHLLELKSAASLNVNDVCSTVGVLKFSSQYRALMENILKENNFLF